MPTCWKNCSRWARLIRQSGARTMVERSSEEGRMENVMKSCLVLLAAVTFAACVNQRELNKRQIQKFMQTSAGEYRNDAGEELIMVPVYSRMIGLDTIYVERTSA